MRKQRKTTHIRIYKDTKDKLKIEASKRSISILELVEEKLNKKL